MSSKKQKSGSIVIPNNVSPGPHEYRVAVILKAFGKDVVFIEPSNAYKVKSADIFMDGLAWEIKSPKSSSYRSLTYRIRKAIKQSKHVIIDTSKTKLNDTAIIIKLRKISVLEKSLQNLKIVTKDRKIIDIK
jgi:hypothetical protein